MMAIVNLCHQCAEGHRPFYDLRAGKKAGAALQECTHRRYRAGEVGHYRKGCRGKVFVPRDEIDVNMPLARAA